MESASAPQGLGVGTITLTDLRARSVEVYSQESEGGANYQVGYAGTLSPETPALQVPAGVYKLKFANLFTEHVRVESGKTTRLK